MRFLLLYDCPIKTCDKMWLCDNLKHYGEVKVISTLTHHSYFRIGRFMPNLKIGRAIVKVLICIQSIRCIIRSNKDDIIITWLGSQGCILDNISNMLNTNRNIVSFNWIRLPGKSIKMIKRSFLRESFMPIINDKSLKEGFIKLFELKKWNGIFLPDVFDNNIPFRQIEYSREKKYIFAGGVNNRDWDSLLRVAKETPSMQYVVVSNKNAIKNPEMLSNLVIKENLSTEAYYGIMKGAFITISPLKEDRVSGLINILKSSQYGIPCISTKLDVTEMYYSDAAKKQLLYERGDYKDLKKKIEKLYSSDRKDYIKIAKDFQGYIKENFSPEKNVEKLVAELKRRGWM